MLVAKRLLATCTSGAARRLRDSRQIKRIGADRLVIVARRGIRADRDVTARRRRGGLHVDDVARSYEESAAPRNEEQKNNHEPSQITILLGGHGLAGAS